MPTKGQTTVTSKPRQWLCFDILLGLIHSNASLISQCRQEHLYRFEASVLLQPLFVMESEPCYIELRYHHQEILTNFS